jgi:hypothetical protein
MGAPDYDFIGHGCQVHIREQLFSHLNQYYVPGILPEALLINYNEDVTILSNGLFMTDRDLGARDFSEPEEEEEEE